MTGLPSRVTVVCDQLGTRALCLKHSDQGQLPGAQPPLCPETSKQNASLSQACLRHVRTHWILFKVLYNPFPPLVASKIKQGSLTFCCKARWTRKSNQRFEGSHLFALFPIPLGIKIENKIHSTAQQSSLSGSMRWFCGWRASAGETGGSQLSRAAAL